MAALPLTLIINASSRRGSRLAVQAERRLCRAGYQVRTHVVEQPQEFDRLLKLHIERRSPLVVVGGGDGTLSRAAGLLAGTDTALGILPLGTGNTFARTLGLPLALPGAVQAIVAGRSAQVDVGRVNGVVFLNSVALGVSALLSRRLSARTKRRLGLLAWPLVGVPTLLLTRSMTLELEWEEDGQPRRQTVKTRQLSVANGRYLAGPLPAEPDASAQDGQLDVLALGGPHLSSLVEQLVRWVLRAIRGRRAGQSPQFELKVQRLTISSNRRLTASRDGESDVRAPLTLSVEPGALRVIVGPDFRPR